MSYGQGQDNPGTKVLDSTARYLPFGDWRVEPAHELTDQGFTGQKHNMDLGLYYYNARWYLPGLGRFASADTLVPDPMNPQQFNRYTYVLNNPLNFTDPSGHCKGSYDPATGSATEDQECWDFLYNDFCGGGDVGICDNWLERLSRPMSVHCGAPGNLGCLSFGSNYWTRGELLTLRDSLAAGIGALNNAGYDGYEILEGIRFTRVHGRGFSMAFPASHVYLSQVTEHLIWHEVGHNISFRNGRKPQNAYFDFAEGLSWFHLNDFCYRAYCHVQYNWWRRVYTRHNPEYFADGFAAWVHMQTYGSEPTWSFSDSYANPNWQLISRAVEVSLVVTFNP